MYLPIDSSQMYNVQRSESKTQRHTTLDFKVPFFAFSFFLFSLSVFIRSMDNIDFKAREIISKYHELILFKNKPPGKEMIFFPFWLQMPLWFVPRITLTVHFPIQINPALQWPFAPQTHSPMSIVHWGSLAPSTVQKSIYWYLYWLSFGTAYWSHNGAHGL